METDNCDYSIEMEKISKKLSLEMERKRYTFSKLAKMANVRRSTLHGWLNGKPPKGFIGLVNVANILEISLDSLFGQPDDNDAEQQPSFAEQLQNLRLEVVVKNIDFLKNDINDGPPFLPRPNNERKT